MIEEVAQSSSGISWKHNTQVKDWKARKSTRVTKSTYSNSEHKYSTGLELQSENQGQENNQEGFSTAENSYRRKDDNRRLRVEIAIARLRVSLPSHDNRTCERKLRFMAVRVNSIA